ncbi:hypothetical protein MNBD_GAMMA15-1471 [hydrothermal vent metagenome]|uniref:CBS domain-containing protein n=1 Tax=hydrothermal vent metagenome TaxID=652676 RepID=A0A3B0YA52_9ZZZZ
MLIPVNAYNSGEEPAMRVSKVMTCDVQSCDPQTDLETVAMQMWNGDCGSIPVMGEEGMPVGMITDRDIAMAGALQNRALRDIRTCDVINGHDMQYCMTDDTIEAALAIMASRHVRRLPVIDETGTLKGVLSIDNIVTSAERGKRGQGKPDLSFEDAMDTLKAICTHH